VVAVAVDDHQRAVRDALVDQDGHVQVLADDLPPEAKLVTFVSAFVTVYQVHLFLDA